MGSGRLHHCHTGTHRGDLGAAETVVDGRTSQEQAIKEDRTSIGNRGQIKDGQNARGGFGPSGEIQSLGVGMGGVVASLGLENGGVEFTRVKPSGQENGGINSSGPEFEGGEPQGFYSTGVDT